MIKFRNRMDRPKITIFWHIRGTEREAFMGLHWFIDFRKQEEVKLFLASKNKPEKLWKQHSRHETPKTTQKILTNELSQLYFMVKFYYHLLNFSLGTADGSVAFVNCFEWTWNLNEEFW